MTQTAVHDSLSGKRILLTGCTGFLGKVWLEMALRLTPDIGHVYLLSRAGKASDATSRLEGIINRSPVFRELRTRHGRDFSDWLTSRITVIDGDVALPNFGLSDHDVTEIAPEIDLVINFAGITDFQPDPKLAEQVNVQGALYAADFAAKIPSKALLHVSTCYVAGARSGHISETIRPRHTPNGTAFDPTSEHEQLRTFIQQHSTRTAARIQAVADHASALGWPNIYTYSKALAEHLLWQRDDIHCTFARPSIVECAVEAPFEGWNEGINTSAPLSWLIASLFRNLPAKPENRFDIIPVDTVARGIFLICHAILTGTSKPIYHLASSDINPLTFGRTIELNGLAVRRYTRLHGGTSMERLLLRHLDPVGVPLAEQGLVNVSTLKDLAATTKKELASLDAAAWIPKAVRAHFAQPAQETIDQLHDAVAGATRQLRRVEKMLELYQPFIHDNDYEFCTQNIRALSQQLFREQPGALAWNIEAIDWRTYWIDVEYPGLKRWSIPLLHGTSVPLDPPPAFPVQLHHPDAQDAPRLPPQPTDKEVRA